MALSKGRDLLSLVGCLVDGVREGRILYQVSNVHWLIWVVSNVVHHLYQSVNRELNLSFSIDKSVVAPLQTFRYDSRTVLLLQYWVEGRGGTASTGAAYAVEQLSCLVLESRQRHRH